jgi:hypothetical protein
MTRRIAFGIVLAALVAVAPGIARAACGGVGKRVLTRDPGSVSFEHGRTDERLLPYYWAATHQPGSGDCGVHARSTLPGVSVFQTYGETHPAAEAFSPNSIPVGGAIGDAPPGAAIGPEIPGTLRIKVYDWAPPGSGRIDLFHNTACDVCPRKLEFMGSLRVYVNPQLQLSGSLYDPQQVLSVQAQDRTRLDVADGVFPVPAGALLRARATRSRRLWEAFATPRSPCTRATRPRVCTSTTTLSGATPLESYGPPREAACST